jgi:hypothetical protein
LAKTVQLIGQGKDHMEVRYRQQVSLPLKYPLLTIGGLALRAVPVAATIKGNT